MALLIIAVFNQSAYDNLVAQVKAAGFKLDMPGSEDIYTNGTRTIACYKEWEEYKDSVNFFTFHIYRIYSS